MIEFETKVLRRIDTGRFVPVGSMFFRAESLQSVRDQLSNFLPAVFFKPKDYLFITRERALEPKPFVFDPEFWKGKKA